MFYLWAKSNIEEDNVKMKSERLHTLKQEKRVLVVLILPLIKISSEVSKRSGKTYRDFWKQMI